MDNTDSVLAIVDGAAFGSEIGKVLRYLEASDKKCVIFAPESFEYILLKSNIIDVPASVLEETYKYADSCEHMSWEEFYTSYLMRKTKGTVYQYNKSRLIGAYKTKGALKKILDTIPEQISPAVILS